MTKRAAAALLWFAGIWIGYEIAWSVADVPRILGPMLAFVGSSLVTIDPFGWFWPRTEQAASSSPVTIDPSRQPA